MEVRCWDCGQQITVPDTINIQFDDIKIDNASMLDYVTHSLIMASRKSATWRQLARVAISAVEKYRREKIYHTGVDN